MLILEIYFSNKILSSLKVFTMKSYFLFAFLLIMKKKIIAFVQKFGDILLRYERCHST